MSTLARAVLVDTQTVTVTNVHQIDETEAVIVYDQTDEAGFKTRYADCYTVAAGVMDTLLQHLAGKKVVATLVPGVGYSQPTCSAAVIQE